MMDGGFQIQILTFHHKPEDVRPQFELRVGHIYSAKFVHVVKMVGDNDKFNEI